MNKRAIYVIVAVILGIISVVWVMSGIKEREAALRRDLEKTRARDVVVSTRMIKKDESITPDSITTLKIPHKQVEAGAFSYPDAAVGKIAKVDIYKNQQITSNLIMTPSSLTSLSEKLPQGMRAFSIPVDKISAVEGMLASGDYVDIMGIFAQNVGGVQDNVVVPMFYNVLVLVGGGKEDKRLSSLTLALSPEHVSLLTYAMTIGQIKLTLRAKGDKMMPVSVVPVNRDKLWEQILGIKAQPSTPPVMPETVEIYRGTEMSTVEVIK